MRFGIGYDAHKLIAGLPLVLAGVGIPHDKGLEGHSDGDVATHAIIDALLGAAALGDIGTHFPATDPSVPRGVASIELLEHVRSMLGDHGWRPENVDATIIAQRPLLQAYVASMRESIANVLDMGIGSVSIKASTEDHLGYSGSESGIAAIAVASIVEGNS